MFWTRTRTLPGLDPISSSFPLETSGSDPDPVPTGSRSDKRFVSLRDQRVQLFWTRIRLIVMFWTRTRTLLGLNPISRSFPLETSESDPDPGPTGSRPNKRFISFRNQRTQLFLEPDPIDTNVLDPDPDPTGSWPDKQFFSFGDQRFVSLRDQRVQLFWTRIRTLLGLNPISGSFPLETSGSDPDLGPTRSRPNKRFVSFRDHRAQLFWTRIRLIVMFWTRTRTLPGLDPISDSFPLETGGSNFFAPGSDW